MLSIHRGFVQIKEQSTATLGYFLSPRSRRERTGSPANRSAGSSTYTAAKDGAGCGAASRTDAHVSRALSKRLSDARPSVLSLKCFASGRTSELGETLASPDQGRN